MQMTSGVLFCAYRPDCMEVLVKGRKGGLCKQLWKKGARAHAWHVEEGA